MIAKKMEKDEQFKKELILTLKDIVKNLEGIDATLEAIRFEK